MLFVSWLGQPHLIALLQRSLLLSPEQRAELIQLRRLFISKLSSIIDQRKEIHALLSVSKRHSVWSTKSNVAI